MKRTITVLQDDIDNGAMRSTDDCPIALAATRDLADLLLEGVSVGSSAITLWPSVINSLKSHSQGLLPEEAEEFVVRFDNSLSVEPFKFEIEIPEEY